MGVESCKNRCLLNNKKGQGTVEYILILVVTVGVILGVLYQLNTAFRVFADNYFGDYLTCLLEAGELPALGGKTSGVCNKEFEEFDLANGRPLVGSGTAGGNSGDGDDGGSDDGDGDSDSVGNRGGGGGSGRGALIPAGRSSGGLSSGRPRRFAARSKGASATGENDSDSGNDTGSAAITNLGNSQNGRAVRIPLRNAEGLRAARRAKKAEEEKDKTTKVTTKSQASAELERQQLIPIQRKLSSTQEAPDIEEFSFGNYLRYLIIAIIIIAIVVVVGGEARQVSKSLK